MAYLTQHLEIERCPHCHTDQPTLTQLWATVTKNHAGENQRHWHVYSCARCGGVVLAMSPTSRSDKWVESLYPSGQLVDDVVPGKAREYLKQAIDSIHAPAGAVMLAASAVDAMLKEKGYIEGNLFSRIDEAAKQHLITSEMATWAHQVRLDANDERHADAEAELPNEEDATRSVEFAKALAEFLFILPSRVTRGLQDTKSTTIQEPQSAEENG